MTVMLWPLSVTAACSFSELGLVNVANTQSVLEVYCSLIYRSKMKVYFLRCLSVYLLFIILGKQTVLLGISLSEREIVAHHPETVLLIG